jgi:serine protease Do
LEGVEVADLDPSARRELNLPQTLRGALVVKIDPDSAAAEAGLRPGEVIVEINRQPVPDADTAVSLSEQAKGDAVLVRVWSSRGGAEGGTRFVVVESGKRR